MSKVLVIVLLGLTAAVAYYVRACPCDRVPGLLVWGEAAVEPIADWSFVNEVPLCQLQVQGTLPRAINLNCMSADSQLYVSCSNCAGKGWSTNALKNPHGYLKAESVVYPVNIARVTAAELLDIAWRARINKLGIDASTQRPDHWWSFQLTSR